MLGSYDIFFFANAISFHKGSEDKLPKIGTGQGALYSHY